MSNSINQSKIKEICLNKLRELNLDNEIYLKRLDEELWAISAQNEDSYFLDLHNNKKRFQENENNLLVAYLLGLANNYNPNKDPECTYGEFPDIDIDFIPGPRSYLKEEWAKKEFGSDKVCNIATYTTFGLRNSLLDMARVFGLDHKEIQSITKNLGAKDDEGEMLTWDKALELYDNLKEYVEQHPEMAKAAKKLIGRCRNLGVHASGLIISGVPIDEHVPLVVPPKATQPASAWVEGLHGTDLGAVGLVKFDFLSLDGNTKIAEGCHLASTKLGQSINTIKDAMPFKVSALPGKGNWSDLSYLNDQESLKMANDGDLKMIFQFDGSDGIRRLAKQGGVTQFEDLVAYTSIYRPSVMKCLEENSNILTDNGNKKIKTLIPYEDKIAYVDDENNIKFTNKFMLIKSGKKKVFKVKTKSGKELILTEDHKIMSENKTFKELKDLKIKDKIYTI